MHILHCAVAEHVFETTVPNTWSTSDDQTQATLPQASADDPPTARLDQCRGEASVEASAVGRIEKMREEMPGFYLIDSRPLAHPDMQMWYVLSHRMAQGRRPQVCEQWFIGSGDGGPCQVVLSVTAPVIAWPGIQSASARMGRDMSVRSAS